MPEQSQDNIVSWVGHIDRRVERLQGSMREMENTVGELRGELDHLRQAVEALQRSVSLATRIGWGLLGTTLIGPLISHWIMALR